MVVITALWMVKQSLTILAAGARQLVVQEAFETTWCLADHTSVVDAQHQGQVFILGGSGDDDFLGAAASDVDIRAGFVLAGSPLASVKIPVLRSQYRRPYRPTAGCRGLSRKDFDHLAVDDQVGAIRFHFNVPGKMP
jgi:hypothetical protein